MSEFWGQNAGFVGLPSASPAVTRPPSDRIPKAGGEET